MKLMIVESPKKIKSISPMLGADWRVVASVGHVRDLPVNTIGVVEPDFKPEYQLTERGKEVIGRIKPLVAQASEIYLATDPDREGESISWHLQQCLSLKSYKRVTFNEITETAIKKAILNPRQIDMDLVHAQDARRSIDRLVGYPVSQELSRHEGEKLSAGRVQSPALYLLVKREREIRAFKQTKHFSVRIFFKDEGGQTWFADWALKPLFVTDDNPYFMDRDIAEAVAKTKTVLVKSFSESEKKRSPPAPFNTATLQQAASVVLGLSTKECMDEAQKLYEQGAITYHRTDNPNISDESYDDIKGIAEKLGLELHPSIRRFPMPDGAQAGHAAITPAHWEVEMAGETKRQIDLYQLIRNRAIACQLADAKYAVRSARLVSVETAMGNPVEFDAIGRTLIYKGWLSFLSGDQTDESVKDESPNPIPLLKRGDSKMVASGTVVDKKTIAPKRYTEASLVKELDALGIGRPSTFAAIIENIKTRNYVGFEKKFMYPTASAFKIVDALLGKFQFINIDYTKQLEVSLDGIAKGALQYKPVVTAMYEQLKQELAILRAAPVKIPAADKSADGTVYPCPKCGKPLRRIKFKERFFWGCTDRDNCKGSLPDANGKPGSFNSAKPAEAEAASSGEQYLCKKCGKPLVHRVRTGEKAFDFWGCSGFKDGCKTSYNNDNGKPKFI